MKRPSKTGKVQIETVSDGMRNLDDVPRDQIRMVRPDRALAYTTLLILMALK
jgi:hypothetical protein